jgi:hypothetical protein
MGGGGSSAFNTTEDDESWDWRGQPEDYKIVTCSCWFFFLLLF